MKYRQLKKVGGIFYDLVGFHTTRKIVIIESDDWGSIRMPSAKVLKSIPKEFYKYYDSPYYKYDTLASAGDLEALFDVLASVKDKRGRGAVLTANSIMANPDFERIQKSQFNEYFYEKFTKTLDSYYGKKVFKLWQEGMEEGCFYPQLHGREHVDYVAWMKMLKNKNIIYIDAFNRGIYSINHDLTKSKKNLSTALDSNRKEESLLKSKTIYEACEIFKNTFDYSSTSFIAPSYTWNKDIEKALSENGIKLIQGIRAQKIPTSKVRIYKYKKHFFGQKNKFGQYYLLRNVFFEPTLNSSIDSLNDSLSAIDWSFKSFRPAIICMHRLNVVGVMDERNRNRNLKLLKKLLKNIVNKWPEVEFMSSNELYPILLNSAW